MHDSVTQHCIRHGETDWNAESRYQGQANIPLNARGRAQAQRNGLALRALLPQIAEADFVASPLDRACETMRIVRKELGLPPEDFRLEPRLREVHYGHWEGKLRKELPELDPVGVADRKADPFKWRPEGGESYSDLMDRVVEWLETVTRDTVIAAHGGVSRALRGHLLNADMDGILRVPVPQDRVLVIRRGEMHWL